MHTHSTYMHSRSAPKGIASHPTTFEPHQRLALVPTPNMDEVMCGMCEQYIAKEDALCLHEAKGETLGNHKCTRAVCNLASGRFRAPGNYVCAGPMCNLVRKRCRPGINRLPNNMFQNTPSVNGTGRPAI